MAAANDDTKDYFCRSQEPRLLTFRRQQKFSATIDDRASKRSIASCSVDSSRQGSGLTCSDAVHTIGDIYFKRRRLVAKRFIRSPWRGTSLSTARGDRLVPATGATQLRLCNESTVFFVGPTEDKHSIILPVLRHARPPRIKRRAAFSVSGLDRKRRLDCNLLPPQQHAPRATLHYSESTLPAKSNRSCVLSRT